MRKTFDIPSSIGPFKRYLGHPSTMKYGYLYVATLALPFAPRRKVYVWLPGDYSFAGKKDYPVMYMSDGQNMVDKHLTKFGDWHLDRVVRGLRKEGYREPILVGVASPSKSMRRANELNPPYVPDDVHSEFYPKEPIGDQFVDSIVNIIKPLVESLLHVDKRQDATAIGGSSMGGIMAFYAFLRYPKLFGFSLSFSTPFFFYKKESRHRIIDEHQPSLDNGCRLYFYVGGKDFESIFTEGVFEARDYLRGKYGFTEEFLGFDYEEEAIHHEEAWYRHSDQAFRFWLSALREE